MAGGDPFKYYRKGERLRHQTVNALIQRARPRANNHAPNVPTVRTNSTLVLIHNQGGSGEDVEQYGILGITGTFTAHADNEDEFLGEVVLTGEVPEAASSSAEGHEGKFAVAQEPIAINELGYAVISGVTQVQIDVTDEDHQFADVKDGDNTQLESAESGAARILWKEAGTGTVWAVVNIGSTSSVGAIVLVRIDTPASGGGKYIGNILQEITGDISESGNIHPNDLGFNTEENNCLILNLDEVGQSTHDLTEGTPKVDIFVGKFLRTNSDGKSVVAINGSDWEQCT